MKLAALSYAAAIYALFFNLQPVLVGVLQKAFGFDEAQLGEIMSTGFFASCLVLGSSYFWVNRIPRRFAIGSGICLALAGLLVSLMSGSYVTIMIGMSLFGGGLAVMAAPVVLAIGELPNPTRAFGFGVSAMVLMASLSVYLIPVVLYPISGFPGVIVFMMLLVVVTLFLLPFIPESIPVTESRTRVESPSSRFAWMALGITVLYFLGLNSNWAFLELIGDQARLTTEAIGVSISIGLLAGITGSLAATVLHDRVSVAIAMAIAIAGFLVYVGTIVVADTALSFGIAVMLFSVVWNFSLPYTMDLVRLHDSKGRLLGLVPAAQALGGALGPLAGGSLLMFKGPLAIYGLLIFCVVFCAIAFAWLERRVSSP